MGASVFCHIYIHFCRCFPSNPSTAIISGPYWLYRSIHYKSGKIMNVKNIAYHNLPSKAMPLYNLIISLTDRIIFNPQHLHSINCNSYTYRCFPPNPAIISGPYWLFRLIHYKSGKII